MTNVTVKLPAGAVPPVLPDDVAPVVTVTGMTVNVTTGGGGAVSSVNGHVGVVVLGASDVGADASGAAATAQAAAIAASQPVDSDLTAIAALSTTAFGRSLLTLADAAAARTTLDLGTAALADTGDFDAAGAAAAAQAAAVAAAATDATTKADAAQAAAIAASESYADAQFTQQPKVADGAFAAIDQALSMGRGAALQLQGDSTSNETTEWFYLLGAWLAARWTNAHVKYKLWNDTNQNYDPWTVVQAGSGERHALFPSVNGRTHFQSYSAVQAITGDIDVRVRVALDDYTNGNQALISRRGSSGSYAWKLELASGNQIRFTWSADGTTEITTLVQASANTLTDGQEYWIRATLDVDNGSGGYTGNLYTSSDGGATWTNVKTLTTSSGTTSIYNPTTQDYELGGYGFTGGVIKGGKIYEAQIRNGIDGKIVNPQGIDNWIPRNSSGSFVAGAFGGGATLYLLNGSNPGADYAYFSDATRHPKMVHPYFPVVNFQSCMHNDNQMVGAAYITVRAAWQDLTDARTPGAQTVIVTQNPEVSPRVVDLIHHQEQRRTVLMSWAARRGLVCIDTYKAFTDQADPSLYIDVSDGIHPSRTPQVGASTTGQALWAKKITDAWLLASAP